MTRLPDSSHVNARRGLPLLLALACASCTANVEGVAILADASPVIIKKPPTTKEITSPSCENITNLGQCENGVATVCNTQRDTLATKDCAALGLECVIDLHQGADCRQLTPPAAPDPATSCPGGKVDTRGFCEGSVAIWCDLDQTPAVSSWDCSKEDKLCKVDDCKEGAYCCSGTPDDPGGCGELTVAGICTADNKAKWCDEDSAQVLTLDCNAWGDECQIDTCTWGASCCPKGEQDCDSLGTEGECVGNLLRYCTLSEVLKEEECPAETQCQFDTCVGGFAWCCAL